MSEDPKELLREVYRFLSEVEGCPLCNICVDDHQHGEFRHGKHTPKQWEALKKRMRKLAMEPRPN